MNYPIKKCSCFGVWIFFVFVMLLISGVGGYLWFTQSNNSCSSKLDQDIKEEMKRDPDGNNLNEDSSICERAKEFSEDSYEDANISAEAKAYIDNNCRVNVSGSSKRSASATIDAQSTSPV